MYVLAQTEADRDALKAKLAEAEKERDESDATLELIMAANQRAVDRWRAQDPDGRKLTLPDLADHLVWTFEQLGTLQDVERDRDALRAKLDAAEKSLACAGIVPSYAPPGWLGEAMKHDSEAELCAKLEASEAEVRRLQVVANEDRAVSDAIRGERERLRAKLDAMSSGIADEQRSRYGLERRVTELEAKLDGVLDVLKECHHYQNRLPMDCVMHIRSALAAAENTGDAGRTPAGQCSTDRSTDGQPPTSTEPAVDEPGPVTNPAVSHPSPAPGTFKMTEGQHRAMWVASTHRDNGDLANWIESLVTDSVAKAREGWVTREVAERALEQCALEYISGSSVHANAKDYLTAAIRAASKEASDGPR